MGGSFSACSKSTACDDACSGLRPKEANGSIRAGDTVQFRGTLEERKRAGVPETLEDEGDKQFLAGAARAMSEAQDACCSGDRRHPKALSEASQAFLYEKVAEAAALDAKSRQAELASATTLKGCTQRGEPFQDKMYREATENLGRTISSVNLEGSLPRRKSSENITMEAYVAKHVAEFNRVLDLEKEEGWDFKKEEAGVRAYTKAIPGQALLYFKGVASFECEKGPLHVMMAILNTEDRPKWDDLCALGQTPQFVPPFYKYAYVRLKAHSIASARDLLTLGRMRFEQDGAITMSIASTEHSDYPETPGYVRINFIEGGYVIRPKKSDPRELTVTWTGCVDPKGWLPKFLVNMVVTKQAVTLAKIKHYMAIT